MVATARRVFSNGETELLGIWSYYYAYFYGLLSKYHPRTVLDIGAANGAWVRFLRDRGMDCHGLDVKDNPLMKAEASHLPFKSGCFDLVSMMEVIEHISYNQSWKTLQEVARVLRRESILFMTTPNGNSARKRLYSLIRKRWCESGDHCNLYTPQKLEEQLSELGFERVILQTFPLYVPFVGRWKIGLEFLFKLRRFGGGLNSYILGVYSNRGP